MKKRICIIGTNELSDYYYDNGDYITNCSNVGNIITSNYDVDNFSYSNLSGIHVLNELNERLKYYNYSLCILSIDILFNKDLWSIEEIEDVISLLIKSNCNVSLLVLDAKNIDIALNLNKKFNCSIVKGTDIKLKKKKGFSPQKVTKIITNSIFNKNNLL